MSMCIKIIFTLLFGSAFSINAQQQQMNLGQAVLQATQSIGSQTLMTQQNQMAMGMQMKDSMLFPGCQLIQEIPSNMLQCNPHAAMNSIQSLSLLEDNYRNQVKISKDCMNEKEKNAEATLMKGINDFQKMLDEMSIAIQDFEKATTPHKKNILDSKKILYGDKNRSTPTLASRLKGTVCYDKVMSLESINKNSKGLTGLQEQFEASYQSLKDSINNIPTTPETSSPEQTINAFAKASGASNNLLSRQIAETSSNAAKLYRAESTKVLEHLSSIGLNKSNLNQLVEASSQGVSRFGLEVMDLCYKQSPSLKFTQTLRDLEDSVQRNNISESERKMYERLANVYKEFASGKIHFSTLKNKVSGIEKDFPHTKVSVQVGLNGNNSRRGFGNLLYNISNSCQAQTGFNSQGEVSNSNGQMLFSKLKNLSPKVLVDKFKAEAFTNIDNCSSQMKAVYDQEKDFLTQNVNIYNGLYSKLHQNTAATFRDALMKFEAETSKIEQFLPGTRQMNPQDMTNSHFLANYYPQEFNGEIQIYGSEKGELFNIDDISKMPEKLESLKATLIAQKDKVKSEMKQKITKQSTNADQSLAKIEQVKNDCQRLAFGGNGPNGSQSPLVYCNKYNHAAQTAKNNPNTFCQTSAESLIESSEAAINSINPGAYSLGTQAEMLCSMSNQEGQNQDDTASNSNSINLDNLCNSFQDWDLAKEQAVKSLIPVNYLMLEPDNIEKIYEYVLNNRSNSLPSNLKEYLEDANALDSIEGLKKELNQDYGEDLEMSFSGKVTEECSNPTSTSQRFCSEYSRVKSELDRNDDDFCRRLELSKRVQGLNTSFKTMSNGEETITGDDGTTRTTPIKVFNDDESYTSYQDYLDNMSLDEVAPRISRSIASQKHRILSSRIQLLGEQMLNTSCSSQYGEHGSRMNYNENNFITPERRSYSLEEIQNL